MRGYAGGKTDWESQAFLYILGSPFSTRGELAKVAVSAPGSLSTSSPFVFQCLATEESYSEFLAYFSDLNKLLYCMSHDIQMGRHRPAGH